MMTTTCKALLGTMIGLVALGGCDGGTGGNDLPDGGGNGGGSVARMVPMALESDQGDVTGGDIEDDAPVGEASGGKWGEFVAAAEEECAGPPARFTVESATMKVTVLGGLLSADALLTGGATLLLCDRPLTDPGAIVVNVASAASLTGIASGAVGLNVTADPSNLAPLYEKMLSGDFYVGLDADVSLGIGGIFLIKTDFDIAFRASCE